jgi:thiamine-monophosphate kinase
MFDPKTPVGEIGERNLLRWLRARIPLGPGVTVGVGDDAASLETGPCTLVTTDSMVEDIHFRRDWFPPTLLGRKALTVNLSDIAAMSGIPRFATVSLGLPPELPVGFVDGLYDGLLERAAEAGVSVVGGNLAATRSGVFIDVTVLGQGDRVMTRAGACAGDLVVVTGLLGGSAAGLKLLGQGARLDDEGNLVERGPWTAEDDLAVLHCLRCHLDPTPPLAFGRALSEHEIVHAGMDISDGLSGDLLTLCAEGDIAAWLDSATVPVDPHAQRLEKQGGGDGFSLALHGGEDYQLLLAVPPDRMDALRDVAVVWDVPVCVVGEFTEGPPALSVKFGDALRKLRPRSHDHFADPDRPRRADSNRP